MTERYGSTRITTIRAALVDLRKAVRAEGTPDIQDAWDRLEPWLDCPDLWREGEQTAPTGAAFCDGRWIKIE